MSWQNGESLHDIWTEWNEVMVYVSSILTTSTKLQTKYDTSNMSEQELSETHDEIITIINNKLWNIYKK